ncbi:MAG: DUF4249 domain-containing protein [Bacteroidota bacterium]
MNQFQLKAKRRLLNLKLKRLYYFVFIALFACTEPTSPEFEFESGLIYVDAFISDIPGSSFVTIAESIFEFGFFRNEFIANAQVVLRDVASGREITLAEEDESYIPASDFTVAPGEVWELQIELEDGRQYQSLPEAVSDPVPINAVDATYNPELVFDIEEDRFVPGHALTVTFDDPTDEDNFYLWRFRSFERLVICAVCENGVFREGQCLSFDEFRNRFGIGIDESAAEPQYTYTCASECWQIRFNETIEIFSDEFSNGALGNRLAVADVLLYTKNDILVELEQYALTAEGHRYFRILKDIVDNNGNFNAPPPAALLGNMFNPNDSDEFVLGRFTIALAASASIFIDRTNIPEAALEAIPVNSESSDLFFGDGLQVLSTIPCEEGRFRTGTPPEGWISN